MTDVIAGVQMVLFDNFQILAALQDSYTARDGYSLCFLFPILDIYTSITWTIIVKNTFHRHYHIYDKFTRWNGDLVAK